MPVITQINEASDKIFDVAESTNTRARGAAETLVNRIQGSELPFADRFAKVEVPFADRIQSISAPLVNKLPEPLEAVEVTFDFVASGIESNRAFAGKLMNRFADAETTVTDVADKTVKAAKKTPAKTKATKKA